MKKLNYSLERRIPYLTNRLASAINEVFSLDLAEEKLTIANWRVLSILHDIGDQKLIELSMHTSIDASTLSRLTESMQRRRLIGDGDVVIATTGRGDDRHHREHQYAPSHRANVVALRGTVVAWGPVCR